MHKAPLFLGLLALAACKGEPTFQVATAPDGTPAVGTPTAEPTPEPTYEMVISGEVTDAQGSQQARLAGPGTLASTTTVQAVTLSGSVVATADVAAGVYDLGLETVPNDALLTVQALDAAGAVLGSVVVELTALDALNATPLTIETSVEAEVLAELLADNVPVGVWAEVRNRIDVPLALVVSAESNVDLAIANSSVAVQASWEAHVDAWEAAGVASSTMSAAYFEAATTLSAALAAGDSTAYTAFQTALHDAAIAQGLTEDAVLEADAIAAASVRAAILAVEASEAVTLEAVRAATLTESTAVQTAVTAQVSAMIVAPETTEAIDLAFDDLETAIGSASSVEDVEAAVQAWRDTVLGAIEAEFTSGLDFLDQLIGMITDALAELGTLVDELQTTIDSVIAAADGIVDADALAIDIAAAYDAQEAQILADLADFEQEVADAMATVSLSFAGL